MFFSILFLMSLGMMLFNMGITIHLSGYISTASPVIPRVITESLHGVNLMFTGSFLASLCWVSENQLLQ